MGLQFVFWEDDECFCQNVVPNDFYASGHQFRPHNADWKPVDMCKDNSLKTKKNQGKQCTEHTL